MFNNTPETLLGIGGGTVAMLNPLFLGVALFVPEALPGISLSLPGGLSGPYGLALLVFLVVSAKLGITGGIVSSVKPVAGGAMMVAGAAGTIVFPTYISLPAFIMLLSGAVLTFVKWYRAIRG